LGLLERAELVKPPGNERSPSAELDDEVEEVRCSHDTAMRGDPSPQDLHGKHILHAPSIPELGGNPPLVDLIAWAIEACARV
jgi:hypothetical protein